MGKPTTVKRTRQAGSKTAADSSAPTGLADALFTATQQRVLALLFDEPERSFYTSELIEKMSVWLGNAAKVMARLQRFAGKVLRTDEDGEVEVPLEKIR